MMENTLVYHGAHAPIEELLDHAIKNPVRLDARDVEVVEAARAVEGEVWSPQLPAYRAWAAEGEAGDVAGGAGREGDLYSAGALWMGEFDELLAQAAERDAADAQETPRARMEEGLRGAVGVRQVPGGYALTAFDLRRFAAAVGQSDDLAVLLPAYVDGIPVVRVAVEAFARRFVQGVGVLLLVVPDTVEHIAANAFAAMSAQRIHIGRGVSQLGEQRCDLAGVSPRLARREYSVDAGNARYLAREGNLFSDGGRELVFLASPYGERVSLPDGVERVASSAFADGCEPPAVVDCSAALPRQVEGRPLVRIGVRALPFAPASVVVPETVRIIERDNACRGTKRLILPEGLVSIGAHCFWSRKLEGPVLIPASVRSVGEGSFEYAVCRLSHVGAIVHVSADQLLTCFLTGYGREAQERIAREGDRNMVEALVKAGFIDDASFDRQIELLRACNRTDCVAYLMEHHRAQAKPTSAKERFAL